NVSVSHILNDPGDLLPREALICELLIRHRGIVRTHRVRNIGGQSQRSTARQPYVGFDAKVVLRINVGQVEAVTYVGALTEHSFRLAVVISLGDVVETFV